MHEKQCDCQKISKMPVDFFRDTWVRYLGYANEVGEAFRGVVPKSVVNLSYKVAFGYVACDTASKSVSTLWREGNPVVVAIAAGDALIWQTLASVVIPGFTINRICWFSKEMLQKHAKNVPPHVRSGMVIAIGLGSIPIIIRPIDHAVTVFMNITYRKIFGQHPK